MKVIDKDRVQCRVVIEGEFNGEKFTYTDTENSDGSQFIWLEENDPSTYWWTEGNYACDCNRVEFLPAHLKDLHDGECGHRIKLFSVTPIEKELPTLIIEQD
jgi:hypothetical protein